MNDLTTGSIPRHLGRLAAPMAAGMIFQTAYYLVDLYFVAKLGAGLVVIGTRGHTGLAGVLLGSVAQDVIAHIKVPVTLVK